MRFMMLMIPRGYEKAEPGVKLDPERVKAMMKYNESLQKAGVLLALDGLHPPSMGARVSFRDGKPKVTDGPFAEAKEVLGGYWMIQVKSREEAIEWAKRCRRCPTSRPTSRRRRPGSTRCRKSPGNAAGDFQRVHRCSNRGPCRLPRRTARSTQSGESSRPV
jgi:hypothetical protein